MQQYLARVSKVENEMKEMTEKIAPLIRKSLFWYKLNVIVVVASVFVKIWMVK